MHLRELWLTDVRSYAEVAVGFPDGLTAVLGPNGNGKTNLLEAVGYLATAAVVPRGSDRGAGPPGGGAGSGPGRGRG